jgi:hypothetical protein
MPSPFSLVKVHEDAYSDHDRYKQPIHFDRATVFAPQPLEDVNLIIAVHGLPHY